MLPNRSTDADNPRLISDCKGLKEDRKGGRREREVELGREEDAGEERWRYGEARRTRRVSIPKGNQVTKLLSIINYLFSVTNVHLIE